LKQELDAKYNIASQGSKSVTQYSGILKNNAETIAQALESAKSSFQTFTNSVTDLRKNFESPSQQVTISPPAVM
jgi:septation ring formation regulator EzrA